VAASDVFVHPLSVRYLEVDMQGVVFNMWYLAYFDDAMTAFLGHRGLPYQQMLAAGYDVQLVHSELDWRGGLKFGDDARIAVSLAGLGRSSFTLDFEARRQDEPLVWGRTVYVAIGADGSGKRAVPDALRAALGQVQPLRPADRTG
jgi:acyl-CoA thioester hydrolase